MPGALRDIKCGYMYKCATHMLQDMTVPLHLFSMLMTKGHVMGLYALIVCKLARN